MSIDSSIYFSRILIKLGRYGIIRFLCYIDLGISFLYFYISLIGLFISRMINYLNTDLKIFVAFSSVIYINFSIFSVFMENYYRIFSFVLFNFHHRFRSFLFFLRFGIFNLFSKSRLVVSNSGFALSISNLFFFNFILFYINLFSPLTLGFLGEATMFVFLFYKVKELIIIMFVAYMINIIYNVLYLIRLRFNNYLFNYLYSDVKISVLIIIVFVFIISFIFVLKVELFRYY